jgi:hypothetical protein
MVTNYFSKPETTWKQALQQFTNPTVQLELENSIKSLDQARSFANLDSLKQTEEVFHEN